jgi:DNA-binding beta-propeller fold protein YncE
MTQILPIRVLTIFLTAAMVVGAPRDLRAASPPKRDSIPAISVPDLEFLGGRRLVFERTFASDREVTVKRKFWTKVLDLVAGPPDLHNLVRPYGVAVDSTGRVIVTDPGLRSVHIFDFARQRYKLIYRDGKEPFRSPQCVTVDADDNFYVTDSEAGKIFVFDADGKLRRVIGSLRGGEGYFKRPTGIAVDSAAQRIYVTDTLRQKIFVLDMEGSMLQSFGKGGTGPGEFNFPTELKLIDQKLYVVDAMNFRVQILDLSGKFLSQIGGSPDSGASMFRPKGIAVDSERNLYVVDGLGDQVHVVNQQEQLLYYFGGTGTGPEQFQLPSGVFITPDDHIYVVDSYNRRVQVLRYESPTQKAEVRKP